MGYKHDPGVVRRKIIVADCICTMVSVDAIGSYDTLTKKWVPDKDTNHVSLVVDSSCPVHSGTLEEREAYIEKRMEEYYGEH